MRRIRKRFVYLIIAVLAAGIYGMFEKPHTVVNISKQQSVSGDVEAHFIDVGQADSIFLKLTDGRTMLIDAGNNDDGDDVVSYITKQGVDRIDYLVGTHPHEDHIGGLDDVIESLEIGKLYMPRHSATTKTFEDVLDAVEEKGLKINTAKAGVNIISEDDLTVDIISPVRDNYDGTNEFSSVILLKYKDVSYLFTGDAEAVNEYEIEGDIDVDVLKVGHHGSDTSSTKEFLNRTSPTLAVISAGEDNSYGHPHKEVIERLEDVNAKILRTDESGTIIVCTDGNSLVYETERN